MSPRRRPRSSRAARRGRLTAWAAAAALSSLLLPAGTTGQVAAGEVVINTLSIGEGSLTEVAAPFGVTFRLGDVRFDANSALATASYRSATGLTSRLSGLTDVTVRMLIPLMEGRGRFVFAGNVPTGTSALTLDQIPVAGVITTDLLAMPVRSFGSGAGVTTGMAMVQPLGDWVVGGVAAFRVGGAYEPVIASAPGTEAAEFQPGSEIRVRFGVERPNINGVTVRAAASWSRFGRDFTDDRPVFDRGDRIMGQLVAEFPFLQGAASAYLWNLYRSESEILLGSTPQATPASSLLGAGAAVAYPLSAQLTLRPRLELLVQSGDPGYGGGSGWFTRVGSAASYGLGSLRLEPAALLQFGSLEGDGLFGLVLRGGVLWQR